MRCNCNGPAAQAGSYNRAVKVENHQWGEYCINSADLDTRVQALCDILQDVWSEPGMVTQ